ncbi:MAG: hypothetical protein NC548_18910 [Lachnospiraceae bacterium]|nr:hypothetical protein [Lachnospiraceae bacterium]
MSEFLALLMILLFLGCIVAWIIIWICITICRITGKCPKGRICKKSICKNRSWCKKYQRQADIYYYAGEILREKKMERRKKG